MDTSTVRTTQEPKSAKRVHEVSDFGWSRSSVRRRLSQHRPPRSVGASPVPNPRRDLSMFDPRPVLLGPLPSRAVERLEPVLPPVISEPPRRRGHRSSTPLDLDSWASVRAGAESAHAIDGRLVAEPHRVDTPQTQGARARLTGRGRAVMLGLLVAGVALCSAVSVGASDRAPAVEPSEVVARGGESVESVAARTAQGRDVQAVAESIRAANGLVDGELPQAGEVLVVPGF